MSDEKPSRPIQSINDSLESGNPSGKTVLIVLGCAAVGILILLLYSEFFR